MIAGCPLCAAATEPAFEKDGFHFQRCCACGHLFLHPPPTPEQEAEYYGRPEVHSHYVYNYFRQWHRCRARRDLAFIRRFQRGGRVLDVGCSYGFFLEAAAQTGWETVGLEVATLPGECARGRGLTVHARGIEHAPLEPGSFDLITFLDSFEHHAEPRAALAAARRWLKPEGRIVLKLPNVDSFTFKLAGPEWTAIFGPGHPHYYGPARLARLLREAGFEIEHLSTNSSEPHWPYFVAEALWIRRRNRWQARGWGGAVALFDKLHANLDLLAALYFLTRPLYYLLFPLELWLDRRLLGHQIVAVAQKKWCLSPFFP